MDATNLNRRLLLALLAASHVLGAGQAFAQTPNRVATLLPPTDPPLAVQVTPVGARAQQPLPMPQPVATQLPKDALTIDRLLDLAAANNPELAAAQARSDAAQGRLIQAGLYPNPRIGWMGSQVLHHHNAAGEEGPLLYQEIVTANKLRLSEQAAAQGVAAADWQAVTRWYDVVTRVRMAFFELLTAQAQVKASLTVQKLASDGHDAALKLQKAGTGTRPDVLQAQVEVNQAELRVSVARQREDAAWKLLAVAVGMQRLPAGDLIGSLESQLPYYEWQPLLETTLTRSSEVQEALANVRQADTLVARARAEVCPNVTVGVRPFYSFPDQDKRLQFEISMPLPVYNRNQGNIHSAEADVMLRRQEIRAVELKLEERLATAFQRYKAALQQVEAYQSRILPQAKESLDLVRLAYERGDAKYDYAAFLQAQRTLATAELAQVQALGEVWRAAVEIAGLLQD